MSTSKIHNRIGITKKSAFLLFCLLSHIPLLVASNVEQSAVDDMNNRLDASIPGRFELSHGKVIYTNGYPPLWAVNNILDYIGGLKGYGTGGINPFKYYTHKEWAETAIYHYSMGPRNMKDTWAEKIGLSNEVYGVDLIASNIQKLGPSVFKDLHEYQLKMADRAEFFGNLIPLILRTLRDWKVVGIVFVGVLLLIGLPLFIWNASKALFKWMMVRRPEIIGPNDTSIYKSWWSRWRHKNIKLPQLIVGDKLLTKLQKLISDNKRIARLLKQKKRHPYPHVLAFGPPGVGKTLFAKKLAQLSNMHYIYTTMADFAQLSEEEALSSWKQVLAYAKANGPVLLIIDEFDLMFEQGDLKMKKMRVLWQKMFANATNRYVQVFAMTNYKHKIPMPVLSRLTRRLPFEKPSIETLKLQFISHLTATLKSSTLAQELTSLIPDSLLEGLTGRHVQYVASGYALRAGKTMSWDILEDILKEIREDLRQEEGEASKQLQKSENEEKENTNLKKKTIWK